MQQFHMLGMPHTVVRQPVGYPPHTMPVQATQWHGGQSSQNPCGMVVAPAAESMPSVSERPEAANDRLEGQTETEEDPPTPQMDAVQGWSAPCATGIPAIVHGAVPYTLAPQMACEPAFMYHHHGFQPHPAQYGYSTVQAGL